RTSADGWEFVRRSGEAIAADGGVLAGADGGAPVRVALIRYDQSTSTHDLVLIEAARDPSSGALALIIYGLNPESTLAASSYLATVMLPNRASLDKAWHILEWTSAGAASLGTFALVASGS